MIPEFSLDDFFWRAILGGVMLTCLAGPLGCLVVWRRMAYFGESLGHSALLGVALGVLLHWQPIPAVMLCCVGFACLLYLVRRTSHFPLDTLLGIIAHSLLAAGLLLVSFLPALRVDMAGYLFGDILAIRRADLWLILMLTALGLVLIQAMWRPMLMLIFSEELARAEGVKTKQIELLFTLLMAAVVAVAMHMVGILLVVALLIIPAATAHRFSRTPEIMALLATLIGALATCGGLTLSLLYDVPSGPAIVSLSAALFVLTLLYKKA